jgi:hypothetical protein
MEVMADTRSKINTESSFLGLNIVTFYGACNYPVTKT